MKKHQLNLNMIRNYFLIAWRTITKNLKITAINLFGLATGMAAAVMIMLWVQNELSFDSYHSDTDRIFRITNRLSVDKDETWVWENSPYVFSKTAKEQASGIDKIARISPMQASTTMKTGGDVFTEKSAAYVDEEWFNVFDYKLLSGSIKEFTKHPFSMLITKSKAKALFGNRDPVGKIISVDTVDYMVQGVLADNPVNSTFQFDVLVPVASKLADKKNLDNEMQWGNFNYMTFLKLSPNVKPEDMGRILSSVYKQARKDEKVSPMISTLLPLKEMHFESELKASRFEKGDKKLVYVFAVLAVLLLGSACINYVNLTTARSSLRAREVGIKKLIGAERKQLFFQFLSESLLLSFLALVLTIAVIQVALPFFNDLTGKQFSFPLAQIQFWLILGGTLFVTVLLNGIYPALLLSSFKPIQVIGGTNALKLSNGGLRKILVIAQFTFSIALIIGTIVIFRQIKFIRERDPGYKKELVFEVMLPWQQIRKFAKEKRGSVVESMRGQLNEISAVQKVSVATPGIVNVKSSSSGGFDWNGRPEDFNPTVVRFDADHAFQDLFQVKIAEGRWFYEDAKADEHGFILNETAVAVFNLQKPYIGQRFVYSGDTGQVIGIVKDLQYKSIHEKVGAQAFRKSDEYTYNFYIKAVPGNTSQAIRAVEKTWKEFFPSTPFEYNFVEEQYQNMYRSEVRSGKLVVIFSVIAVLISCLGLFGLATFASRQRSKEISIRKILGASVQNIVGLLSRDFLLMIMISALIAFPVSWFFMNKWLDDFAYKISIDVWIFITAGAIAVIIALVSISFQAIRAALSNPVKTMRAE